MGIPRIPAHLPRIYDTDRATLTQLTTGNGSYAVLDLAMEEILLEANGRIRDDGRAVTATVNTLHLPCGFGQLGIVPVNHASVTCGWLVHFLPSHNALVAFPQTLAVDVDSGPVAFPTLICPTAALAVLAGLAHAMDDTRSTLKLSDRIVWRVGEPVWNPQAHTATKPAQAAVKPAKAA